MESFKELLKDQIVDLYDEEHQLIDALPKMIDHATNENLRDSLKAHLKETKEQVKRLEKVFKEMNEEPKRKTCKGMQGIIKEGEDHLKEAPKNEIGDMAIVASGLRVEHYEIAGYKFAIELADKLDMDEVKDLLEENLEEEIDAADTMLDFADEDFFEELKNTYEKLKSKI